MLWPLLRKCYMEWKQRELIIHVVLRDATVMPLLHYCLHRITISNNQGFWVIRVSESVSQSVWKSLCTHENRGAVLKQETGAVAFPTRLQQPLTWFIYTKTTSDSSHTIATCRPVRSPWWTSQRQQGRAGEWVNRDEEWRVLNELVDWDLCIQHSVYKKEKENVILRHLDASYRWHYPSTPLLLTNLFEK